MTTAKKTMATNRGAQLRIQVGATSAMTMLAMHLRGRADVEGEHEARPAPAAMKPTSGG